MFVFCAPALRSWPAGNPLALNHAVVLATHKPGAVIQIGDDCGFTGTSFGGSLVAAERIVIGDRVQVGANSTIVDTDFHPLTAAGRDQDFLAGAHAPIVIEDDVFIGMQSLILKGVTIGRGSVVGVGSVVTKDVPPGVPSPICGGGGGMNGEWGIVNGELLTGEWGMGWLAMSNRRTGVV